MDGSLAFDIDAAQGFGEYTAVQAEKKLKLRGGVPEARKAQWRKANGKENVGASGIISCIHIQSGKGMRGGIRKQN